MKILVSLAILFSSAFAMADWDERQKQNKAEKAFKGMTTAEAIAASDFYKEYPYLYFSVPGKNSLMHDDCFANGLLYGGYYNKCIDYHEGLRECLETVVAPLTMPAAQAPKSFKVRFYRKIAGADRFEQTSSEYYLGVREVAVPNCK